MDKVRTELVAGTRGNDRVRTETETGMGIGGGLLAGTRKGETHSERIYSLISRKYF